MGQASVELHQVAAAVELTCVEVDETGQVLDTHVTLAVEIQRLELELVGL